MYRCAYHRAGNAYAQIEADLLAFGAAYRKLTTVNAPHSACHFCQTHCRYRHEAAQTALRRDLREGFSQALETPDDLQMWQRLAEHCQDGAFQVVGVSKADLPADAVICYALHAAQVMELSTKTQLKILKNVAMLVKPKP